MLKGILNAVNGAGEHGDGELRTVPATTPAYLAPGASNAAGASPVPCTAQLVVLGVALLLLLFWYRGTAYSLVEIWNRSDTFAHGFVIAPISAWLIWRRRDFLPGLPVVPSGLGVLAGALSGFAWLLGELASVASVSQFALVGMVISLVWAVMGTAVTRAFAFPLGFLFFTVPFGEFLFPMMMDWTAEFLVSALRLSGIPVHADGHTLVIPSGTWQVVEGCSGIRYLIASVVVGSLYAYLNYRSLTKRLVFTAAAIVVPVVANWLRAYGIVMLGHFSDNRLATGVDHLVYGWVFFGIVILALFWIGSRWQEEEEHAAPALAATAGSDAAGRGHRPVWLAAALAAALSWSPLLDFLDQQGQHGAVALSDLPTAGKWAPAEVSDLPDWAPRYRGMQAEKRAAWVLGDKPVGLYLAYYRDQKPGEEMINSDNRMLLNKDPFAAIAWYGTARTRLGERTLDVRGTEMFNPQGRLLVWHWYWIGGRWTANEYLAKAHLALLKLSGRGDDSAMVAIFAPFAPGQRSDAEARLAAFAEAFGPQIEAVLETATQR